MKKILYIILGMLALLIITNPSVTAFKTYLGRSSYAGLQRPVNLFVCAFYKDRSGEYFGMVGNFWKLEREVKPISELDRRRMEDSIKNEASPSDTTKATDVTPPLPKGYTRVKK